MHRGGTGAGRRNQCPVLAGSDLQPVLGAQETCPIPSGRRSPGSGWEAWTQFAELPKDHVRR